VASYDGRVIPFERNPERKRGEFEGLGGRLGELGAGRAAPPPASPRLEEQRVERAAWLIGPLLLSSVAAGMLFVFRGPDHVFGVSLGLVLGLAFLWMLISVLFPAKPDRTCPSCGERTLERLDPQSTQGVRCSDCGWQDEAASSFLMAEEDGSLADTVLRERRRRW
jgi:hypothetical protein